MKVRYLNFEIDKINLPPLMSPVAGKQSWWRYIFGAIGVGVFHAASEEGLKGFGGAAIGAAFLGLLTDGHILTFFNPKIGLDHDGIYLKNLLGRIRLYSAEQVVSIVESEETGYSLNNTTALQVTFDDKKTVKIFPGSHAYVLRDELKARWARVYVEMSEGHTALLDAEVPWYSRDVMSYMPWRRKKQLEKTTGV